MWLTASLLLVALTGRAKSMLVGIPRDAAAVYEQQYQTARFLAAFYPHQAIGLNDIGAPDFFADIDCIDLFGLASSDVARLRRAGQFDRLAVERVTQEKRLRVAVLYPEFFSNEIPYTWIPVSSMVVTNLPGKVQLGERRVTLYAPNPHEAAELLAHLRSFRNQLPPGVELTTPSAMPTGSMAQLAAVGQTRAR